MTAETAEASTTVLQFLGAGGFGALIGWYVYFVNRYRDEVKLNDLGVVAGVIGGGAILKLFPEGTDLFGAYGIGLFVGFFGYLVMLFVLVSLSDNFDKDWFLDGRCKEAEPGYYIPRRPPTVRSRSDDPPDRK